MADCMTSAAPRIAWLYNRCDVAVVVSRIPESPLSHDQPDAALTSWFNSHSQFDVPIRSVFTGWHPDESGGALTGATSNMYRYFDGYDSGIALRIDSPHQPSPPAGLDDGGTTTDRRETVSKRARVVDDALLTDDCGSVSSQPGSKVLRACV